MAHKFEDFLTLAEVARKAGRHADAIEYFDKALQIDPAYTKAWAGKAAALLQSSVASDIQVDEAMFCFNQALELDDTEANKNNIVTFILAFCDAAFVSITSYYVKNATAKNAAGNHTDNFLELLKLLIFAGSLKVQEKLVIAKGIKLCALFMEKNLVSTETERIKAMLATYTTRMKEIDPTFAGTMPVGGCLLVAAIVVSGLVAAGCLAIVHFHNF